MEEKKEEGKGRLQCRERTAKIKRKKDKKKNKMESGRNGNIKKSCKEKGREIKRKKRTQRQNRKEISILNQF